MNKAQSFPTPPQGFDNLARGNEAITRGNNQNKIF